jgi:hypothetical protein
VAVATREEVSTSVRLYSIVGGALAGFFLVGFVGGSVRNFIRGYREGRAA